MVLIVVQDADYLASLSWNLIYFCLWSTWSRFSWLRPCKLGMPSHVSGVKWSEPSEIVGPSSLSQSWFFHCLL